MESYDNSCPKGTSAHRWRSSYSSRNLLIILIWYKITKRKKNIKSRHSWKIFEQINIKWHFANSSHRIHYFNFPLHNKKITIDLLLGWLSSIKKIIDKIQLAIFRHLLKGQNLGQIYFTIKYIHYRRFEKMISEINQ